APFGVTGWTWESDESLSIANGTSNVAMVKIGYMMAGTLVGYVYSSATNFRRIHGQIEWDGTTLKWTPTLQRGTGVSFSGTGGDAAFIVSGTSLRMQVSNAGSALTGCKMQAEFVGIHTWMTPA